jgi:hypothetical protein
MKKDNNSETEPENTIIGGAYRPTTIVLKRKRKGRDTMEYPKSWESDVQNWMNDPGEPESYIVTNEDDGLKVHKVKNVNWLATAKANWKALTAAVTAVVLITGAVICLVRHALRK